jgi:hypothetical protein
MPLLFSVTRKDFDRDTFRCPGKGGQNVNKRDSGVRFTHRDSGAVGKSCTHREQKRNEEEAFLRLLQTPEWVRWHKIESARHLGQALPESPEALKQRVDAELDLAIRTGQVVIEEIKLTHVS